MFQGVYTLQDALCVIERTFLRDIRGDEKKDPLSRSWNTRVMNSAIRACDQLDGIDEVLDRIIESAPHLLDRGTIALDIATDWLESSEVSDYEAALINLQYLACFHLEEKWQTHFFGPKTMSLIIHDGHISISVT